MVPVLSNTTTSSLPARSNASLDLNRIPCSAPKPVPTITAVGVANPIAHGQAITRTAIILIKARVNWDTSGLISAGTTKNHTRNVMTAIPITMGTKTDEI